MLFEKNQGFDLNKFKRHINGIFIILLPIRKDINSTNRRHFQKIYQNKKNKITPTRKQEEKTFQLTKENGPEMVTNFRGVVRDLIISFVQSIILNNVKINQLLKIRTIKQIKYNNNNYFNKLQI